ncbi:pfkB-like carbohydrate kinase family protein [Actinidia rufa]|uniref:PfkB-like carbohydrate kinase family protein n=1 Tax=Actinidia rufa TaxID=165716 RepID=A0A7J0H953_9ERIC|nr:pfkB-like carbohydrate kinase family protein [Actinidia rufa]
MMSSSKDDVVIAESLGGAASFISVVLDGLSIPSAYVAKVGSDFAYPVSHDPIVSPSSKTTLFHAHFSSEPTESRRQDRVLKRVRSCDPILPSDLPGSRFDFGLAVGVGGEILPETLERMLDYVHRRVRRRSSPNSGFRFRGRNSENDRVEGDPFVDVDEARKLCCVVVTNGKDGCTVHWKDAEYQIAPFSAVQIDPTGAGDSFLGGLVAGLVQGLAVPDAALLGNFCGSLTVGHIGLPKFDSKLLQRVKDEVSRRKMQCSCCLEGLDDRLKFVKSLGHDQFHSALGETKLAFSCSARECQRDLVNSTAAEQDIHYQFNGQQKVLLNPVFEEPIQSNSSMP